MKMYLKTQKIHPTYTQNEQKSNYSERSMQNLRNRMYRMFKEMNTYEYISKLSDITKSINNTPSRHLNGTAAVQVKSSNESEIRLAQYLVRTSTRLKNNKKIKRSTKVNKHKKSIYKYKIGDRVRITQLKGSFQIEYTQRWTDEIYQIDIYEILYRSIN